MASQVTGGDSPVKTVHARQSRRRRRGRGYCDPIEARAAAAVAAIRRNGWTAKQAAAKFCVNAAYLGVALQLDDNDLLRLEHGGLKLSTLYQGYRQRLAERRSQRLAAEREIQAQAAHEAQTREIDFVLASVELFRVVDRIVDRFSPQQLLWELERALRRRDQDLGALIVSVCDPQLMMQAIDRATAPQRVAAE